MRTGSWVAVPEHGDVARYAADGGRATGKMTFIASWLVRRSISASQYSLRSSRPSLINRRLAIVEVAPRRGGSVVAKSTARREPSDTSPTRLAPLTRYRLRGA